MTARQRSTAIAVLALLVTALLVTALLVTVVAGGAGAATQVPDAATPLGTAPVVLILDASGSMNADDGTGTSKIDAARGAVLELIEGLPPDAPVGLRAYGHRTDNVDPVAGCADTEQLVAVGTDNRDALREAVAGLQASGFTPIGASLRAALADLPDVEGRTVVLVSDGIDTCAPPAACTVAQQIVAEGVQLRVETVGFQVDAAAAAELRCIADSTGGTYRSAEDAEDLARELRAYVTVGTPVEGGPTPAEALVLAPGQYTDTLVHPVQRWYAVELQPGDRLRASVSVIGGADLPTVPDVDVELVLGHTDVIGLTPCATDVVSGIGPFTRTLAVDGLRVSGGTVCGDAGNYAVGLRVLPQSRLAEEAVATDGPAAAGLDVELLLAVTSDPVAEDSPPAGAAAVALPSAPVVAESQPTAASAYVVTFAAFLGLGGVAGVAVSRRLGP